MTKLSYDYYRIKISTTIVTKSPLHCGDGEILDAPKWDCSKPKNEGTINTICKAENNKPYIPASTLRGSLRNSSMHVLDNELFGDSHENGNAGKVRVYDAISTYIPDSPKDQFQHTTIKTTLKDGVAIKSVTNTAKDGQLYIHEVVPANSKFNFVLEADKINEEQLDAILEKLGNWNGGLANSIGKGKSKGWGRIEISKKIKLKTLKDADIKKWVEDGNELRWEEEKDKTIKFSTIDNEIKFTISPQSPLLINDHSLVKNKPANATNEQKAKIADLVFMQDNGKAIIPGSSIKGLVRSHAHKILATIAHVHFDHDPQEASVNVENIIEELFGNTSQRSILWFDKAIDSSKQPRNPHTQFFNAIDRFTGGVLEGALYSTEAADCEQMKFTISYNKNLFDNNNDWIKGLLLLVIRDFMQDGFSIGWGKAKGYGYCKLTKIVKDDNEYLNFEELINEFTQDKANEWIKELHNHIKNKALKIGEKA